MHEKQVRDYMIQKVFFLKKFTVNSYCSEKNMACEHCYHLCMKCDYNPSPLSTICMSPQVPFPPLPLPQLYLYITGKLIFQNSVHLYD